MRLIRLNTALFAPMPSASTGTAVSKNVGVLRPVAWLDQFFKQPSAAPPATWARLVYEELAREKKR
jgi:hypothetical protein